MQDQNIYDMFRNTDGYYSGIVFTEPGEQRLADLHSIEQVVET